jgi:hypothetical protein
MGKFYIPQADLKLVKELQDDNRCVACKKRTPFPREVCEPCQESLMVPCERCGKRLVEHDEICEVCWTEILEQKLCYECWKNPQDESQLKYFGPRCRQCIDDEIRYCASYVELVD